ncbi:hypothetical protein AA106555_1788 [Neokomagataea thailandica NBRC 106555]|uniref:Replication protein n=2 Tax=Neokomagataea thailandica TaxID=661190 RepID=A0ABQ0QS00_9PROT|nr:hypothetical protein AA106555_1788 [Neokomagataea thailandica NBRC 106555]
MSYLSYEQVLRSNTGRCLTDKPQEMNDKRERLSNSTRRMADKLEGVGIQAFDAGQVMTEIGDVSGDVSHVMGRYRNLMLLPEVAKRARSETIKQLSYFIENHRKGKYFRYMVVTSGDRVPLSDDGALRERRKKLTRNFSRWVYDAKKYFGIRVVCRSDEYTFNDEGAHYHTNVIYYPSQVLSSEDWQEFLDFTRRRLGNVWVHDAGILNDLREAVKYICKLSGDGEPDRDGCDSWGADELSAVDLSNLHKETYKQKHFQPVGEFSDWLRENADKKVVNYYGDDGSCSLRLMQKPKPKSKPKKQIGVRSLVENVIVHRTLPQPSRDGILEPKTLVLGYTTTPSTGVGRDGLKLIQSNQRQARAWVDEKKHGPFIVHNSTPTVQADRVDNLGNPLGFRRERREAIRRNKQRRHQARQTVSKPAIRTKKPQRIRFIPDGWEWDGRKLVTDFPGWWSADDPRWIPSMA